VSLLTGTSAFRLGRRHWISAQRCYLHCLDTLPYYISNKSDILSEMILLGKAGSLSWVVFAKRVGFKQIPLSLCSKCIVWYCYVFLTIYRWCTVVSGHWNMMNPRLKMSHSGCTLVRHFQPRIIIFQCHRNDRVSYVLSYGQPLA